MKKAYIGVDLGGTNTELLCMCEGNEVLKRISFPTKRENEGVQILPEIAQEIQAIRDEFPECQFEVLGLAIPGVVDEKGYTRACVNLNWKNKNVKQELEKIVDLEVFVLNDANSAAYGEMAFGASRKRKNSLLITLGTGLGAGIIVDGKIYHGANDLAGEIGHIHCLSSEVVPCNCGSYNCLETYVSQSGLLARWPGKISDVKDIFDRAKKDDLEADRFLRKNFYHLAISLVNYSVLFDPEIIVLGGGIAKAGSYLKNILTESMLEIKPDYSTLPEICFAQLGSEAGVYGALAYARASLKNKKERSLK